MSVDLRPYQKDLYNGICESFHRGNKKVIGTLSCGGGKTAIMSHMADKAQQRGKTTWIILPRIEILEQTTNALRSFQIPQDRIYAGMAITYANHRKELPRPDLMLFDECHLSVSNTYWKIANEFPDAYIVGMTASPCRTDNKPLGDLYTDIINGKQTDWLIENRYLSPYEYYSVPVVGEEVSDNALDYEHMMMDSKIYGEVISSWRKFADGLQTVVYCTSIKHSKDTAKQFNDNGINAMHIDGTTPQNERKRIVDLFRKGEITVLCNCDLISMGFDMPDIGCVMLLRPTNSLGLYIQQSGRALRFKEGKTAVVIDMVSNFVRFGLPDEYRDWDLEHEVKHKSHNADGSFSIRVCPECFQTFRTAPVCPYCGAEYPVKGRELKAMEEVELKRITEEEARLAEEARKKARRTQGMARTFPELVRIGRERGYARPEAWAAMVMRGRR